ncbi:DUF1284 domain-containing protein [Archaeoglobus fulgidus]|uniref:DUF1284 domain-containing protein n=1 Tax=Archaeoglobus fulgidus (strain ATCC 49558 / DSM 4304 / JCM 9628 / NBRC 100126 / VC-16) TaxID=224325 RepID=O28461_ARCFU|nr:DUF1284 domain-containing protein [Archaeoglobus fulgidus]AAB89439.1 predicted coding region AF_1814 [Archaeoglobus fulgidus DSM 4304]
MKLRGHHLICLQFFRGEGYSGEFVENVKKIMERLESGETVEVVAGVDDICVACPYNRGYCGKDETSEERVREMDKAAVRLLGVSEKTTWREVAERIEKVLNEWRVFCEDCDWKEVCYG